MARLPSGSRLEIFDTLDSTSAEAKRRAGEGETGPLWLVAREQTSGYGRRGSAWESRLGDFAGTFLFSPEGDPARLGELSFVAALAVLDALDGYAGEGVLRLKWPNDVLAPDGKIAGLLLERMDVGARPVIALGVGVNILNAPTNTPQRAARLADLLARGTQPPSPDDLTPRLDAAFDAMRTIWRERGPETIRALWLERASGVGEPIVVRLPDETLEGVFAGLDETGALILHMDGEKRIIAAGDVFFGAPQRNP